MFLEQLKSLMIEKEMNALQQERRELLEKKASLENQVRGLTYTGFNIIQRNVTKRKQYQQELNLDIQLQQEQQDVDGQISGIDSKIEEFQTIRQPKIESAKNLQDLGFTFEQARTFMKDHNIDPKLESCKEGLRIAREELSSNVQFMKRAIKEEPRLIMYDKTNDKDLYIEFIDLMISKMEEEHMDSFYLESARQVREEIQKPKSIPEDRYKIKTEHIFEGIRGYAREITAEEHRMGEKSVASWETRVLYATKASIDMSENITRQAGEKLESIYDPQAKFYVHGGANTYRDSVFSKGLRATSQEPNYRNLFRTAKPINSFLGMIGYHYQNEGRILNGNFIIKIPQGTEYIWGSNSDKGEINECYVFPEFVVGEIDFSKDKVRNGEPVSFIENNAEKERYRFAYKDGSPLNAKPKMLEAEEREN